MPMQVQRIPTSFLEHIPEVAPKDLLRLGGPDVWGPAGCKLPLNPLGTLLASAAKT